MLTRRISLAVGAGVVLELLSCYVQPAARSHAAVRATRSDEGRRS